MAKAHYLLWRLVVVQYNEIVFIQIADKFPMTVRSREEHVHFIHTFFEGENSIGLGVIAKRRNAGHRCPRLQIAGLRQGKLSRKATQQQQDKKYRACVLHSQNIPHTSSNPLKIRKL